MKRQGLALAMPVAMGLLLGVGLLLATQGATAEEDSSSARIDAVFAHTGSADVPGCAVGLQSGDSAPVRRAFGKADLEHRVHR